jgi:sterol desaturase/sphingolipid hydroxylase (fatty acid hydroxylase superfamily)
VKRIISFFVFFFLSSYLPMLWDSRLPRYQLFDLSSFGVYGSAPIGPMPYQRCGYWHHRSIHPSNFLFRTLHQMHYSSERLDAYSAFYCSALDMAGWTFIASLVLVVSGGLGAQIA